MLYVICYDVSHNGRRKKVSDTLLRFGDRVQKSAFECDLKTEAQLKEVLRRVRAHTDAKTDTVRAYRICAACRGEVHCIGLNHAPGPPPPMVVL